MKLKDKTTGEIIELKLIQTNCECLIEHEIDTLYGKEISLKILNKYCIDYTLKEQRKMKIFISMPMADKSDKQIVTEFKEIKQEILKKCKEVEFIDSIFSNYDLENNSNTPIHYLGRSIELLADADIVYFAKGWQQARGCIIEHQVASLYGKEIKYAESWKNCR